MVKKKLQQNNINNNNNELERPQRLVYDVFFYFKYYSIFIF